MVEGTSIYTKTTQYTLTTDELMSQLKSYTLPPVGLTTS